jgi:hypothetical protein
VGYRKKDEKKEKKMIMAAGLVIAIVLAVAGTQMSVRGREYHKRVKLLESRGYEIDYSVAWGDIDEYEEKVTEKFKDAVRFERREIEEWTEFYLLFRDALSAPVYDYSIHDGIHCSEDEYVIWFSAVYLRGSSQGRFVTYYIIPDA